MDRLKEFAQAIQDHEGYFPGSRAWRNKNPGNLRLSKFQAGTRDGFSYFDSYEEGLAALIFDLKKKCLGQTRTSLDTSSTILDFCNVWAPSWDSNNPLIYAQFIAKRLNLSISATLGEIYSEEAPRPLENAQPEANFTPKIQRIVFFLVDIENKDPILNAIGKVTNWFENLGIGTTTSIFYKSEILKITEAHVLTGANNTMTTVKIIDPDLVKAIIASDIKNHHFAIFTYKSGGQLTPVEFPQLYLGANIIQFPVLDISTPEYITEYIIHEILHGWYARLAYNGIILEDDVHTKSFTDTRPEANYKRIVESLFPHGDTIFREFTIPEKISGLRLAIDQLWKYLLKLIKVA